MGTALALVGVLLVLFAAAVLATREGPVLAPAPQDRPDLALPDGPLQAQDVEQVRFTTAPRGYRMDEVDVVLDRLAAELVDRDRRLALLQAAAVQRPSSAGGRVEGGAAGPAADGPGGNAERGAGGWRA